MAKNKLTKKQQTMKAAGRVGELHVLAAHQHEHNHQHQLNISPFLSAHELEKMNAVDPAYANKIFELTKYQIEADVENSKKNIELEQKEQEIREKEVIGEIDHKKRGQYFGVYAITFLGLITLGLVYFEAFKTAAAFASVTIVGGTVAFTGIPAKNKNEKKVKSKEI